MNISEYTTIGTRLALSTPEDKIVITGAAGRFPESDNIEKLCENFKNRVYMVTKDERRWKQFQEDVPYHTGKINHIDKLDAGFFDMNYQEAENMDPQCRQILERAFEAILDSGYNPSELENTRTAVLVAATLSDSEKMLLYDNLNSPNYGFTGCSHSMLAHQISYRLGLNGRSLNIDSACSSSLYQLDEAYTAIKMGSCDNALIVGTHLVLNPYLNCSFYKLGMVSLHGDSLVFDGNGYNRSEAAAAIFVQRARDARRIYAEIEHIKSCNDGFKEEGIMFPSTQDQMKMMEEVCVESKVNPNTVTYFEAHAAGTKVGDPQEVESLYQVFCSKRKIPLLIGSAKSLMGHTEPVSGLSSLLKVVLGMNNDYIYPNFHNDKNEPLELLKNKKLLKLVTEATKWHKNGSNLAAINCYGFGGTNSIAIVKPFSKGKVNSGLPKDDLARLVCVSGRTKESVTLMFDDLASKPLDEEYIRLLHAIFSHNIRNHPMRGFIMLSKMGEIVRSVERCKEAKLCLLFNNFNCNSKNVVRILLELPLFQEKFTKIQEFGGVGKGQNSILTVVALHCSLFDSLREIGLQFDFVFGVSLGVLGAAYANGRLTLKEVILLASCIDEACNTLDMREVFVANSRVRHGRYKNEKSKIKLLEFFVEGGKVDNLKKSILKELGGISDSNGTVETFATLIGKLFNSNYFEQNALDVREGEFVCVNMGLGCTEIEFFDCIDLISKATGRGIITDLLSSLGRLHQLGYDLKLDKLYSNVEWPVSRGTPNVSPVIGWNHTDSWHFYRHQMQISNCVQTFDFSLKSHDPNWSFLSGHVLDGEYRKHMIVR
ncbi:hypothetical protein FQA39_LY09986 [Lamprigera yunnana]|nr:hypothetical protein FQA39_LY09986 [Lamprigera yunnana]